MEGSPHLEWGVSSPEITWHGAGIPQNQAGVKPGGKQWDSEVQRARRRQGISLKSKSQIKILSSLQPKGRNRASAATQRFPLRGKAPRDKYSFKTFIVLLRCQGCSEFYPDRRARLSSLLPHTEEPQCKSFSQL